MNSYLWTFAMCRPLANSRWVLRGHQTISPKISVKNYRFFNGIQEICTSRNCLKADLSRTTSSTILVLNGKKP
jgi:hypothetical protein